MGRLSKEADFQPELFVVDVVAEKSIPTHYFNPGAVIYPDHMLSGFIQDKRLYAIKLKPGRGRELTKFEACNWVKIYRDKKWRTVSKGRGFRAYSKQARPIENLSKIPDYRI